MHTEPEDQGADETADLDLIELHEILEWQAAVADETAD